MGMSWMGLTLVSEIDLNEINLLLVRERCLLLPRSNQGGASVVLSIRPFWAGWALQLR